MWCRVDLVLTNVSEEHITSIFSVEKSTTEEPAWAQSAATCSRWFLTQGFFYPEDGVDTFLQNVSSHKICMAPHPRRQFFQISFNCEQNQKVAAVRGSVRVDHHRVVSHHYSVDLCQMRLPLDCCYAASTRLSLQYFKFAACIVSEVVISGCPVATRVVHCESYLWKL
jgi:hypothetical protein